MKLNAHSQELFGISFYNGNALSNANILLDVILFAATLSWENYIF